MFSIVVQQLCTLLRFSSLKTLVCCCKCFLFLKTEVEGRAHTSLRGIPPATTHTFYRISKARGRILPNLLCLSHLTHLHIHGNAPSIAALPASLKELSIGKHDHPYPPLPNSLASLTITDEQQYLPTLFPSALKHLSISSKFMYEYKAYLPALPPALISLTIKVALASALESFPTTLQHLSISGTTPLPAFPSSIQEIELWHCEHLIPPFPLNLKRLHLREPEVPIPSFPASLLDLILEMPEYMDDLSPLPPLLTTLVLVCDIAISNLPDPLESIELGEYTTS